MFTLEAIKREANEASFLKGKSYYRNNRVKGFIVYKKENNKYQIHATVRDSDHYNTVLTVDAAENRILDWHCTCPYHFGGICRHMAAVGMHFYYSRMEEIKEIITKGTVEKKIQKLQECKKLLFDSLVNESGDYMAKLSWEDLKEVLA